MRGWRALDVVSRQRSSRETDHGVSYVRDCQESRRTIELCRQGAYGVSATPRAREYYYFDVQYRPESWCKISALRHSGGATGGD
jgi:hypothetical protein